MVLTLEGEAFLDTNCARVFSQQITIRVLERELDIPWITLAHEVTVWLNKAVIHGYTNMPLGFILLLCSFGRIIVVGFTLDSMIYVVSGS